MPKITAATGSADARATVHGEQVEELRESTFRDDVLEVAVLGESRDQSLADSAAGETPAIAAAMDRVTDVGKEETTEREYVQVETQHRALPGVGAAQGRATTIQYEMNTETIIQEPHKPEEE